MMKAAVVSAFGVAPAYEEWPEPQPSDDDELVVEVVASGLHPRVRSQADGSHYTSTGELPFVPGIDGVARLPDGELRYFILPDTAAGSMAERTVIDRRRSVPLPPGADAIGIAAAMNPAMSSWLALRSRSTLHPGQSVLVLGATGSAGQLAVQLATQLGAGRVIGAGRRPDRLAALPALGADATVDLSGDPDQAAERLGEAAAEVDVVLDYLWGAPTAAAMRAIVTRRADPGRPLTWIEIGSVAGPIAEIPSAALRAARLQLIGSGQGSVPTADIVAELPALAAAISARRFELDVRVMPLRSVADAWRLAPTSAQRIVLTPH